MNKGRLEAFSDGVLAVIITIMVLEMKSPRGNGPRRFETGHSRLPELCPELRIHRHLLEQPSSPAARDERVNGATLWANVHLLFWLSLVPFMTAWMGENQFAAWPVAIYGIILLLAAVAYFILTRALIRLHGRNSTLASSIGTDTKGKISIAIYAAAILLAFAQPWIAGAGYVIVAIMWLIPDRRIERKLAP